MDNAVTRGTLPLREVALHWVRRVAVEALARQPIVSWCLNSVHLNVVPRLRSNLNSLIHFKICEISICIQDRQLQQFSCSLSFAKLQKLASNWQPLISSSLTTIRPKKEAKMIVLPSPFDAVTAYPQPFLRGRTSQFLLRPFVLTRWDENPQLDCWKGIFD